MTRRTLIDPFNRTIDYIRLSVTDRCDLRCFYCLPEGSHDFIEPDSCYDMCKAVDRGMRIEGLRLLHKSGGRSGDWNADEGGT